jgi:phosphatidylglycerol:prolipoprotein diacylglycerol transferase
MVLVGSLTFHWYGLIVGVALVLGWVLTEYRFQKLKVKSINSSELELIMSLGAFAGLVGARLWHVATDWELYKNNLLAVAFIWQGGLSIIGAVVFGIGAITGYSWFHYREKWQDRTWFFLDLIIFGLPLAQAVGRLGNWVNQELYGLPTNVPWAMYIHPEFRLPGYESFEYFHPLFAYEAVAMLAFGALVWWKWRALELSNSKGRLALLYLTYYSIVRFGLEFLRLDKAMVGWAGLGFNQLVMAVVFVCSSVWLLKKHRSESR